MNDPAITGSSVEHTTKFVWRRIEEPLRFFSFEFPGWMWVVLLSVVLAAALFYVAWMYIKDSRGVGPWWASLLGLLRLSVYAVLALVFLLPAHQSEVKTRSEAKVVVVWDVSASMGTSDELPTGVSGQKRNTRMDDVMDFLKDEKIAFMANLQGKNPVAIYRFGSTLDENYLYFSGGRVWTREERENPKRDENGVIVQPPVKPLGEDYEKEWFNPTWKGDGGGASKEDQERLDKLRVLNARLVKEGLMRGTNIGDALLGVINKELNNRLQGIIVFTDGRNTVGSPNAFTELAMRSKSAKIPLFVVGIGEDRQKVKIEIVDLRIPGQIQPEDKFRTVAEITGEGLAGRKLDVSLDITHVRTVKVRTKDKSGKPIVEEKEEELDIELIEKEDPDNPKSAQKQDLAGQKADAETAR